MKKEEISVVFKRVNAVIIWYDEMTGGEYSVSIDQASDLIERLELEPEEVE